MSPTGIRAVASGSGAIGSRTAQAHQIVELSTQSRLSRLVSKTVLASFQAHGSSVVLLLSRARLAVDGSCRTLLPSCAMHQLVADTVPSTQVVSLTVLVIAVCMVDFK